MLHLEKDLARFRLKILQIRMGDLQIRQPRFGRWIGKHSRPKVPVSIAPTDRKVQAFQDHTRIGHLLRMQLTAHHILDLFGEVPGSKQSETSLSVVHSENLALPLRQWHILFPEQRFSP